MEDCSSQYQSVCKDEFGEIHTKLDRLDEAIRGNGKPGLQMRLGKLEDGETSRSRLLWLIAGSAATVAVSQIWTRILGG